jgi:DNA-binding NarL/FixJ family response regulator
MHHPENFTDMTDDRDQNNHGAVIEFSPARKTVLLIESRPLMGEIFSYALREAADDLDVHIMANVEEACPTASLGVVSFVQRSSDPLFIGFVIQHWQARLGNLPLLAVTDSDDPAIGRVMVEYGVRHWVTAPMGFNAIVAVIRQALSLTAQTELKVLNDHSFLDPPVFLDPPEAHQMKRIAPPGLRSEIHLTLTDRETDVLALLQKGKQNKVIAHALNISESTAKVHIRNIMRKFHLHNRTEVALMCGAPTPRPGAAMLIGPDFEDGRTGVPAIAY